MTVQGDYGFAFGFYSAARASDTQTSGIVTTCTDYTGNEIELGIYINGNNVYFIKNRHTAITTNYFLQTPIHIINNSLKQFFNSINGFAVGKLQDCGRASVQRTYLL